MGLNLLVRLLHLLRQALLEEGGSDWVLLSLSLGGGYGRGLRHRYRYRGRSWLNGLYQLLRWVFHLRGGCNTFWLRCRLRFSLFGFMNWFTVGTVRKNAW